MKKTLFFFILFFSGSCLACSPAQEPFVAETNLCPTDKPFYYTDWYDFRECLRKECADIPEEKCEKEKKKECEKQVIKEKFDVNKCFSCDTNEGFLVNDEATCNKCSNRKIQKEWGDSLYCVLKECPADNPIRANLAGGCGTSRHYGSCVSCNYEKAFYSTKEDCNSCDGRSYLKKACYPKCQDGEFLYYDMATYNFYCKKCDTIDLFSDDWGVLKSECEKCPGGEMVGDECLIKCPEGEFHTILGCQPCNAEKPFIAGKEACNKCPNREMVGYECLLKCPEGEFTTTLGCINCNNTEVTLLTEKEECNKCPNREMIDNKCVLKNK